MRVLVTGSRTWTDRLFIESKLLDAYSSRADHFFTVVHGDCPIGADYIANQWAHDFARTHGWPIVVEHHPANWRANNRGAGMIRNAEMVAAGADLCLAFIRTHSRGATHCAGLAQAAGIETRVYEWEQVFA